MKKILLLKFLLLLFSSACYQGAYVIKQTGSCYNNNETMLSSKLNINGYYSQKEQLNITYSQKELSRRTEELSRLTEDLPDSFIKSGDTFYYIRNYLFYNDGMMLYDYIKSQFQGEKPLGYETGMARWGNYTITGDTIKAFIYPPPRTHGLTTVRVWFKIIDSTTVKVILFKGYEYKQITQKDIIAYQKRIDVKKTSNAKFIPHDSVPDPNLSWIKKKKWFWCDEDEWRTFMEQNGYKIRRRDRAN